MKKAFYQLHVSILLAGFTAILGKLIELQEGYIVLYRMAISALSLWAIMYFSKKLVRVAFRDLLKLLGIGAIVALHWVSFYGSIKYSNVSVSVTCLSAIGFFTSFMEPLLMRRKIDPIESLLGLLAIAGIYLIFNFYPEYKTGIIFGIISAFLASIFPILNKSLLRRFSARSVTLYEMAGGTLALIFILPLYFHFFPAPYFLPTLSDWLWLLILSWICTVLAFILSMNALKQLSAFTVNLSYNFEPLYSIIMAFIIFQENEFLGPKFYIGFSLIMLAVTLQMLRVYRDSKAREKSSLKMLH